MKSGMGHLAASIIVSATIGMTLEGCEASQAAPAQLTPAVHVVTIAPQAVDVTTVLPGRLTPFAVAEIRPQASGIIKARLFDEGAWVREGQPLYQIDEASYSATTKQAEAHLKSAQAVVAASAAKLHRYELLSARGYASPQALEDAKAAEQQAEAIYQESAAGVESARLHQSFTRLAAPISGRIGRSSVTVGAFVTDGQATALATVQKLDPIYVDISQATTDLLRLRRRLSTGSLDVNPDAFSVSLQLEDGSDYPLKGKLKFTDVSVDETSGAVAVRAVFPNPKGVLLPGMFVRATLRQGVRPAAVLAPQRAVSHDASGHPSAFVVNAQGKIELRRLQLDGVVGDSWLVTKGLGRGDRLVVDGQQNLAPGSSVRAIEG